MVSIESVEQVSSLLQFVSVALEISFASSILNVWHYCLSLLLDHSAFCHPFHASLLFPQFPPSVFNISFYEIWNRWALLFGTKFCSFVIFFIAFDSNIGFDPPWLTIPSLGILLPSFIFLNTLVNSLILAFPVFSAYLIMAIPVWQCLKTIIFPLLSLLVKPSTTCLISPSHIVAIFPSYTLL